MEVQLYEGEGLDEYHKRTLIASLVLVVNEGKPPPPVSYVDGVPMATAVPIDQERMARFKKIIREMILTGVGEIVKKGTPTIGSDGIMKIEEEFKVKISETETMTFPDCFLPKEPEDKDQPFFPPR